MPNKIDVLARISPQMAAVLAKEDELAGDANDTSAGFAQMRENYVAGRAWWNEGAPEMGRVVDDAVEGSFGAIGVRRYYPCEIAEGATAPAIVYVHGGGFVLGNLDTHDRICRILAKRAGVPVVAVDYRLSPEAKYPSAVREEMGGADFVKCLLLFYGWFGLTDSSSMRLLGGPWDGLTEEDWQFYLNLYAEDPAALAAEPYANLFLNDLTHDVPACYIAAAEFDPLRDDSATLAAICEQYGTPFRFELFEGVIHAFLHYTKMLDAANDALEHGATFYRETLGLA